MAGNGQWSGKTDAENTTVSTKTRRPWELRDRRQKGKHSFYPPVYIDKFFPDTRCQLFDFLGGVNYTSSHDNGVIFNRVVSFFRNVTNTIESTKGMMHFKFVVEQGLDEFCVRIEESETSRKPPRKTLNCISCDTESETSKVSRLDYPSTAKESIKLHNVWLDAKARSMFIITPVRHVERLSDCTDEEVFSMFSLAVQLLYEEVKASNAPWEKLRFDRMILNHGNSRNVEHLHLKIKLSNYDFRYYMNHGWNDAKKQQYSILKSGLYKRDKRLKKIS